MKKLKLKLITFFIIFSFISTFSVFPQEPTTEELVSARKLYEKAHSLYNIAELQFRDAEGLELTFYSTDSIEDLRNATILYNQAAKNFELAEGFFIKADKLLGLYSDEMMIKRRFLEMKKKYITDRNRELVAILPEVRIEIEKLINNDDINQEELLEKIKGLLSDGHQVFDQGEQLFQLGEDIMKDSPTATIVDFKKATDYYLTSIDFFLGAYDYYTMVEELMRLVREESMIQPVVEMVKIKVLDIKFGVDKYNIKSKYLTQLLKLAMVLRKSDFPEFEVFIEGHTDSDYIVDYNQSLSERRAHSVLSKLNSFGIQLDQITTEGYGELEPATTNSTSEGKAFNRRAIVHILVNTDEIEMAELLLKTFLNN
ncbi:OmpA family protein [Candidatus Dependentiae bacterium]|nr:OmpA family protein [Candidatus Dependentiae bacterium]